jgi:hypothetical protein
MGSLLIGINLFRKVIVPEDLVTSLQSRIFESNYLFIYLFLFSRMDWFMFLSFALCIGSSMSDVWPMAGLDAQAKAQANYNGPSNAPQKVRLTIVVIT